VSLFEELGKMNWWVPSASSGLVSAVCMLLLQLPPFMENVVMFQDWCWGPHQICSHFLEGNLSGLNPVLEASRALSMVITFY
jgi:hypothetical protein